jgi:hydroxymethylpyrimidine pyrophosphatase-like HAD family hydrolase
VGSAVLSKLQNMQLVIRKTTYTQSTIPALSVIKEQLDEEEQQLEQAVEEVSLVMCSAQCWVQG